MHFSENQRLNYFLNFLEIHWDVYTHNFICHQPKKKDKSPKSQKIQKVASSN